MNKYYYPPEDAPEGPIYPEGFFRYPKIPITIIYESVELPVPVIVDSGAAATLFNFYCAQALNINVEEGIYHPMPGIQGIPLDLWFHEVTLCLNRWRYDCYAGFPNNSNNLPVAGILGYSGFFDRFEVRLRANRKKGISIRKLRGRW